MFRNARMTVEKYLNITRKVKRIEEKKQERKKEKKRGLSILTPAFALLLNETKREKKNISIPPGRKSHLFSFILTWFQKVKQPLIDFKHLSPFSHSLLFPLKVFVYDFVKMTSGQSGGEEEEKKK